MTRSASPAHDEAAVQPLQTAARRTLIQGAELTAAAAVEAAIASRRRTSRRRTLRAPLVAIDHVIDLLELRHLAGRTSLDDRVVRELNQLSTLVPLTDDVTRAMDTRKLHAALLDPEETVLDLVRPSRRLWTKLDDE